MSRRPTLHSENAPLPVKDGIDPVALILPKIGETAEEAKAAQPRRPHETFGTETVLDYMVARFYPHDEALFKERFAAHEVKDDDGQDVAPDAPLAGQKIWYYRQLSKEKPVPTDLPVLYEDDYIIAVDKPHFLNTTPNGSFVAYTALTLLRVATQNNDLIPVHRLDRLTAGVLVFAKIKEARAPFQMLFEDRQVTKTYEAVAGSIPVLKPGESLMFKSRIERKHGQRQVTQFSREDAERLGKPLNASTRITCLENVRVDVGVLPEKFARNQKLGQELSHYLLEPSTGKTHQLRAHLLALGAPIAGDVLYPEDLGFVDDEPNLPLQLLCREMSFVHPITGEVLSIRSKRQLTLLESTSAGSRQK